MGRRGGEWRLASWRFHWSVCAETPRPAEIWGAVRSLVGEWGSGMPWRRAGLCEKRAVLAVKGYRRNWSLSPKRIEVDAWFG